MATKPAQTKPSTMSIFALGDSWVLLGTPIEQTNTEIVIDDAYVIRHWGTNAGLGQLAYEGIRKDTVLDKQPRTTIPVPSITFIVACAPIWNGEYIKSTLVDKAIK